MMASHGGSPLKLALLLLLSSPSIWVAIYTLHARLPRRVCWVLLPLVALLPVRAPTGVATLCCACLHAGPGKQRCSQVANLLCGQPAVWLATSNAHPLTPWLSGTPCDAAAPSAAHHPPP